MILRRTSLALRWIVNFAESTGALESLNTTGPSQLLRLQELPLLQAM